jgi:hypothetical protein
MLMKLVI